MHHGGVTIAAAASGLTALLLGQLTLAHQADADSTCTGGTLVVCLQLDPVLDGDEQVVSTVTDNGVAAAVDTVRFTWDADSDPGTANRYLLTDHDAPWQMRLRSQRLPDGPGTMRVQAVLTDGRTASTGATVQVSSGQPLPPADPFVPRTAATGPDGRVRLAVVGDGADGSPESLGVTAQIAALDPDVFAYLGDVYDNGTEFEFDTWYDDPAGYGQFRGITDPAIGNHEYRTDGASPYFAYWGGVPHYYSYDLGGWHLVVLDSTTDFADATGVASQLVPGSAQYDWLAQDLAAHQGSCTIAYMHHPRYSNVVGVSRDGLAQVWQLLVDQNVTMVLAGHAHTYERWMPLDRNGSVAPGGLTQFVVGTGGREIINPKGTETRVAAQTTQPAAGALRLDLGPDDAAFSYATTDGTFTDSGAVPCRHALPPDTTPPSVPTGVAARALSPTSATVSWIASSDTVGVAGYTVRRGGVAVATVPAAATSYRDTALAAERRYAWTVEAFDAAGNRSAASAAATATTPFVRRSSRSLLAGLRRAPERDRGFTAASFPGWRDADGDGCNTAGEVLVAEALRPPRVGRSCSLTGGRWRSPYDGKYRTRSGTLVVDHVVPLREAWRSGARTWRPALRRQLANDLGYPATLVAVTAHAASAKAGREPQDWLPRPAYRCTYVADWVAVKWRWRLAVDPTERRFLTRTLRGCGWPLVRAPDRAVS
jgi:Calcineurin-like phosphoesterase/Fibronectin type III domain/Protein of unknown function (DUF1524)